MFIRNLELHGYILHFTTLHVSSLPNEEVCGHFSNNARTASKWGVAACGLPPSQFSRSTAQFREAR